MFALSRHRFHSVRAKCVDDVRREQTLHGHRVTVRKDWIFKKKQTIKTAAVFKVCPLVAQKEFMWAFRFRFYVCKGEQNGNWEFGLKVVTIWRKVPAIKPGAGERQEERYESIKPIRGITCSVNLLVSVLEDQTYHCSQNVHWNNFCLMRSSWLKQTKKITFTKLASKFNNNCAAAAAAAAEAPAGKFNIYPPV